MGLETERKLEETTTNVEVINYKRAFATAILLMAYASLLSADVQKIRPFGVNGDSILGASMSSKNVKTAWPSPAMGAPPSRNRKAQ